MTLFGRWCRFSIFASLGVLTLAAAGCSSRARPRSDRPPPQPLLYGKSDYLDGTVTVDAVLGPFRLPLAAGMDRTPPQPGDGEPIPVSRGGFSDRTEREGRGGFPRGLQDEGAFGPAGPGQPTGSRRSGGPYSVGGGGMPRQVLTVTLRSLAAEPITVRVVEIRSALGNFVPVPETFTLAPGATQELETMRATYAGAIDELELLVGLRASGGRSDSKVLHLKLADPAASAPTTRR